MVAGERRRGGVGAGDAVRRGFSLAEVLVAIVMLGGVALAFATFAQRMARGSSLATRRSTASDLAVERLESVKGARDYAAVDAFAVREASVTGFAGFTRDTYVRRTVGPTADHKIVTVVVGIPALRDSVVKTTIVAAF